MSVILPENIVTLLDYYSSSSCDKNYNKDLTLI